MRLLFDQNLSPRLIAACRTADIEAALRARHPEIVAFVADSDAAFLALA